MPTIKIIVCCHKKDYYVSNDVYLPIQVGKKKSTIDLGICSDDQGVNISGLNHLYCELTGLYWAWNNLDCDYIGLCHYRRYYCFGGITISLLGKKIKYWLSNIFSSLSCTGKYYPFYDRITVNNETELFEKSNEFCSSLKKTINRNPEIKIFALNPVLYGSFMFGVLEEHLTILVRDKWHIDIKEKSIQRLSGYLGELLTSAFVQYYMEVQPSSVKYLSLLQMK